MDKYQKLRETGEQLCRDVIGKPKLEAMEMCERRGFSLRLLSIEGRPTMITADCRMDRLSCEEVSGRIYKAEIG